jgi:creatinine amidohydrolase
LTRDPKREVGVYSSTGIWGDPTLATRAKGKKVTEFLVAGIVREIEDLRHTPLPAGAKPSP